MRTAKGGSFSKKLSVPAFIFLNEHNDACESCVMAFIRKAFESETIHEQTFQRKRTKPSNSLSCKLKSRFRDRNAKLKAEDAPKVQPLAPMEPLPSAPVMDAYVEVTQPSSYLSWECFAKQQRRLEAWDRDLQRRERALLLLHSGIEDSKNWPILYPLIYHDIDAMIPVHLQPLIQKAYWMWILAAFAFSFNWLLITVA